MQELGFDPSRVTFDPAFFLSLYLAVLALRCCVQPSLVAVSGVSLPWLLLSRSTSSTVCGPRYLEHTGSVVGAWGLQSVGSMVITHQLSCCAAYGIFLDQGLNPSPLHWQADERRTTKASPDPAFLSDGVMRWKHAWAVLFVLCDTAVFLATVS